MITISISGVLEIRYADQVTEYPLDEPITTIGRNNDNQIVVSDELASRHHARLEWAEGVPSITDLGSSNGTLVNGTKIQPRVSVLLQEGDVISIGSSTLTLHLSRVAQRIPVPTAKQKTVVGTEKGVSSSSPTMPTLIVGTAQGTKEYHLTQEKLTIGRDPTNDIAIADLVVSGRHAELQRTPAGYEITDLGSTNTLTFESTRISKKLLADSDVLWITDSVSLTYRAHAEAPVAEAVGRPPLTILFTDMEGSTALTQRLGDAKAQELIHTHDAIVRDALKSHRGTEIKHTGDGIMASLPSTSLAIKCAVAIQRRLARYNEANPDVPVCVRIGLNVGEPIAEKGDLFGAAIQLAARVCAHAEPGQILAPGLVRELVAGKDFMFVNRGETTLRGFEEPVRLYEVKWQE